MISRTRKQGGPLEALAGWLRAVFPVHAGEGTLVGLLFGFFFLVIMTFWLLKPARSSLFLEWVGADNLPYVKLGTAIVVGAFTLTYAKLVHYCLRQQVILGVTLAFGALFAGFGYLTATSQAVWVHASFFMLVDLFVTVMVALFWSFANDVHTTDSSKRLYGLIGAGGVLGGIAGSLTASVLPGGVGTSGLLWLASTSLALLLAVEMALFRVARRANPDEGCTERERNDSESRGFGGGLRLIERSRYLTAILGLVVCYEVVSSLVDFQFNKIVATSISGLDEKTAFFGAYSVVVNATSVIVQVFLTSAILRRCGMGFALSMLPLLLGVGSLGFLLLPILAIGSAMSVVDNSLHYTVDQAAKEALYVPTSKDAKYKVKGFIDMFGMRAAKGLGALAIVVVNDVIGLPLHFLSVLALGVVLAWLFLARYLGHCYREHCDSTEDRFARCETAAEGQLAAASGIEG